MKGSHDTSPASELPQFVWISKEVTLPAATSAAHRPTKTSTQIAFDPLQPVRQWLDTLEIRDMQLARQICRAIPAQCPFERDVKLFGRTLFHIPPLCKLNPLYEQFVGLRFRALCYLADDCGEDISQFC